MRPNSWMKNHIKSLNAIVAKRLKKIRESKHISQEELGDMCGLHRTYIGSIERCERNITLTTLEKIASSLNVPPIELLREDDNV